MTLVDQNWITLAGQPIGGRTPTQTLVFGNPMNSAQSGWVRQAYHQFCTEKLTSTGQYLMRGAQFADGTRIRITSINGVDTVRVWTPGVPQEYELQAAFSWKWAPDSGEFGGGVLLLPSKEIKLIDEVPDSYQWDPSLSADDRKGCGVARKNAAAIGAAIGVERKPFCTNEAAGSYLYGWSATAHNGPYVDWARTFTTLPNDTSLGGVFVGQQSAGSAAFAAMAYRDRLFTASAVVSGGAYVLAVATAKIDFSADPEFSSVTVTGMPAGIGRMEGSFNPKQKRLELVAYKNGSDGWNWRGHVDFTLEGGEWVGAASGSFTYPTILTDTYVVVGPHAKPTISIDKDMGSFSASASDPDGWGIRYIKLSGTVTETFTAEVPENTVRYFSRAGESEFACIAVDCGKDGAVYELWQKTISYEKRAYVPSAGTVTLATWTFDFSNSTDGLGTVTNQVDISRTHDWSAISVLPEFPSGPAVETVYELRKDGVVLETFTAGQYLDNLGDDLAHPAKRQENLSFYGKLSETFVAVRETTTTYSSLDGFQIPGPYSWAPRQWGDFCYAYTGMPNITIDVIDVFDVVPAGYFGLSGSLLLLPGMTYFTGLDSAAGYSGTTGGDTEAHDAYGMNACHLGDDDWPREVSLFRPTLSTVTPVEFDVGTFTTTNPSFEYDHGAVRDAYLAAELDGLNALSSGSITVEPNGGWDVGTVSTPAGATNTFQAAHSAVECTSYVVQGPVSPFNPLGNEKILSRSIGSKNYALYKLETQFNEIQKLLFISGNEAADMTDDIMSTIPEAWRTFFRFHLWRVI